MGALWLAGFLMILAVRNVEMRYRFGKCPTINPQPYFEMRGMLGIWFVIEKTNPGGSCMAYNITETDEPNQYKLEEICDHVPLGLTPLKHKFHYTGILKVPDSNIPAKMTITFPLNIAGESSFTVFMTDYDTYAGIFICQNLTLGHRQSAAILARSRVLNHLYLYKIRSRMASAKIDPLSLSLVNQNHCTRNLTAGYNVHIDENTLSTQTAIGLIKKVGKKISDGVGYLSKKTKDMLHKIGFNSGEKAKEDKSVTANEDWIGIEY